MIILICGDRNWDNYPYIKHFVSTLPEGSILVEGEARGADLMSAKAFEEIGWSDRIKRYPADWETYKKAAGPIRNSQMLKEGKPDIVVAFHEDIDSSKGTKHMVTIAQKAEVPVIINPKAWQDDYLEESYVRYEIGESIDDW
ncbi:MAG: hypothetical protein WDA06_15805, partial [Phenylobacterium sp.]